MSNRLGKLLFWGLHALVLLFLAAAMSMPAAADTGGEQVAGLGLLAVAFAVFLWCSIWPARFFWAVTMAIRLPVLALLLLAAGVGRLLMWIDHVVALAGRRVLEIGHGQ